VTTKSKLLFIGLLTLVFVTQCKTKSTTDKTNQKASLAQTKNVSATLFDTINELLHSRSELITEDLIKMKVIDTSITSGLSETCYCDTTIQLNDSIYYSIISANDEAGICTYFYVATVNEKSKNVVTSKYLHPDCDVDYSFDIYELYDHKIISQDKIQITKTTIFQKKNSTSANEDQNIDHKQTRKNFITISETGQIISSK
jgi:hypothetical protein